MYYVNFHNTCIFGYLPLFTLCRYLSRETNTFDVEESIMNESLV
jgi:hypothetical protein